MHAIPFIITVSWIANNFSWPLLNKIIWGLGWGSVYTTLIFNKDKSKISLYQDTIREIIKSLYPSDPGVLKEFNSIWNSPRSAFNFWEAHWKKIVDRMTMKDWYIFAKKDENDILNQYYNFYSWCQNNKEYNIKADDINNWITDYSHTPLTLTSWRKLAEEHISFNQAWRIHSNTWKAVFDTFLEQLKDIRNLDYLDDEEKFKLFFEIYSVLEPVVRSWFGWWEGWDVMKKSPEVKRLKSFWIDLIDKTYKIPENQDLTKDTVFGYTENEAYKKHVKVAYENFKSINFNDNQDDIVENQQKIQHSVDDILKWLKPASHEK